MNDKIIKSSANDACCPELKLSILEGCDHFVFVGATPVTVWSGNSSYAAFTVYFDKFVSNSNNPALTISVTSNGVVSNYFIRNDNSIVIVKRNATLVTVSGSALQRTEGRICYRIFENIII